MTINTSTRSTQVKEHLLDWIEKNQYGQGDQLPPEAEMAKTLGVSRSTVREAYIMLEAEGIIVRKHGSGTFVSRSPMIKESLLDELIGFPHYIQSAGYDTDFKLIAIDRITPSPEVCRALNCDPAEEVLQVKYVLFADGEAAIYVLDHFAGWIEDAKFEWDKFDGSMLEFVSVSLGISQRRFHTRFLATVADEEISTHLLLPEATPIVNIRSIVTTMDGKPINYSVVYLNPQKIEVEMTRIYRHK